VNASDLISQKPERALKRVVGHSAASIRFLFLAPASRSSTGLRNCPV
jgi:hypothetical protein